MDLTDGHIALLKIFKKINNIEIFKFGTGKGVLVLKIIKTFTQVTSINILMLQI
jgi:UDP-glucose 4-epimerase